MIKETKSTLYDSFVALAKLRTFEDRFDFAQTAQMLLNSHDITLLDESDEMYIEACLFHIVSYARLGSTGLLDPSVGEKINLVFDRLDFAKK